MITWTPAPAPLQTGRRLYAIGDVHGCVDRLEALHRRIAEDLAERPVSDTTLIHLGDYVDRGPDSASVVAALQAGEPSLPGLRVVNLLGNHEVMMLAALQRGDPEAVEHWLANGGEESLRSWGASPFAPSSEWVRHVPAVHIALLESLSLTHSEPPYLFVHAGVLPGVSIEWQSPKDLLWIREPFLSWGGDFGAIIVHGHTPQPEPVVRPNRIGIDTGAVFGGPLTCAILEGDWLGFISQ